MVRAPYFDANGVKRGAWSEEEDDKLRDYIQKYGHWNWRELPKYAGLSRCGKSCRLRWVNYLKPNLKRGDYTKEEEDTIIKLHDDFGKKWSAIAAQLPGRTDNEIKNYWHTHLKNRRKKQQSNAITSGSQIREPEQEAESMIASIPSNHILESSPLCPETSYNQTPESSPSSPHSTSFSSSSINSEHVPETMLGSEESLYAYGQSSGDFWTEPFVPDNSYFPNEYASPFSDEGEYLSPYIADSAQLLFQAMQELPEDPSNSYCFRC